MTDEPHRLVFFAFDLLHLDGMELRRHPLVDRKAMLDRLLNVPAPESPIQFSDAVGGDGAKVFAVAQEFGLEGIVSKRAMSHYRSGRSNAWRKVKCMTEGDFIVVGVEPNPKGAPFALLARETEEGLSYAGSAFVNLPTETRDRFWNATEALKVARPVLADIKRNKASFLRPELRVRARHLRVDGMLRHASLTKLL
jgi:ATP-dependent DNA ligase